MCAPHKEIDTVFYYHKLNFVFDCVEKDTLEYRFQVKLSTPTGGCMYNFTFTQTKPQARTTTTTKISSTCYNADSFQ